MVVINDGPFCFGPNNCTQNSAAPKGPRGEIVFGGSICGCPCHRGGQCLGDEKRKALLAEGGKGS